MDDQKNMIIAAALSFVVIVVWSMFFMPKPDPVTEAAPQIHFERLLAQGGKQRPGKRTRSIRGWSGSCSTRPSSWVPPASSIGTGPATSAFTTPTLPVTRGFITCWPRRSSHCLGRGIWASGAFRYYAAR